MLEKCIYLLRFQHRLESLYFIIIIIFFFFLVGALHRRSKFAKSCHSLMQNHFFNVTTDANIVLFYLLLFFFNCAGNSRIGKLGAGFQRFVCSNFLKFVVTYK